MPCAAEWIQSFPRRLRIDAKSRATVRLLSRPRRRFRAREYWARVMASAKAGTMPRWALPDSSAIQAPSPSRSAPWSGSSTARASCSTGVEMDRLRGGGARATRWWAERCSPGRATRPSSARSEPTLRDSAGGSGLREPAAARGVLHSRAAIHPPARGTAAGPISAVGRGGEQPARSARRRAARHRTRPPIASRYAAVTRAAVLLLALAVVQRGDRGRRPGHRRSAT